MISCIIHTRNSAATLERALRSVEWADELVVVDMQSDDTTLEIARRVTDRVHSIPCHPRVDGVRNQYIAAAAHDWVFVLDSDEYLAADGGTGIREIISRHGSRYDAFAFPRHNYIAGQVMRGSRWYPDYQIRLFRKGLVLWGDTNHELPRVVSGEGRLLLLKPPDCVHLHHQNYRDLRHFVERQTAYALSAPRSRSSGDFEFSDYIAAAYQELALRDDPGRDGDLSHALALLMAWDHIVRGVLDWDSREPKPPLGYLSALPVAARELARPRARLRRWFGRHYPVSYFLRRLQRRLRSAWSRGTR
jgi:glycosyltransferase involved in cell wall biosynthesis